MKVKLFIKDKSSFRSWQRHTQEFEDDINVWLAANCNVKVIDIKQSSNGGSFDTTKVVISIWYEPDAESDRAGDSGGTATSPGAHADRAARPLR
jgi:hypothetical protein